MQELESNHKVELLVKLTDERLPGRNSIMNELKSPVFGMTKQSGGAGSSTFKRSQESKESRARPQTAGVR